jgi:hypothetical protein
MASFNKFQDFVEQLGKGVHQLHAAGHTLKVYLTNATQDAVLDAVKADLAEITAQNGYPAGGTDIQQAHTLTVVFREIVDSFTYDYVVTKAPSATKLEFMSDLKAQVLKAREWRNRVATLTTSIDVGQIESFINS